MSFRNRLVFKVARHLWIKRLVNPLLPPQAYVYVKRDLKIFFNARDNEGPSWEMATRKRDAFWNFQASEKEWIGDLLRRERGTGSYLEVGAALGAGSIPLALKMRNLAFFLVDFRADNIHCLQLTKKESRLGNISPFHFDPSKLYCLDEMVKAMAIEDLLFIKVSDPVTDYKEFFKGASATIKSFVPNLMLSMPSNHVNDAVKYLTQMTRIEFTVQTDLMRSQPNQRDGSALVNILFVPGDEY